jgi:parallel beta-helix repeat protein
MHKGAHYLISIVPQANTYAHDIEIHALTLRGRSDVDGFSEHLHLLNAIAVAHLRINNVLFAAFQGDGIYLGTGSVDAPQRHNSDVVVQDSTFDGVNNENRNAISLIDCERCTIQHNIFLRVSRTDMPGSVCIEPNESFEVMRSIDIGDNTFLNVGGNVGAISVTLRLNGFDVLPRDLRFENNTITGSPNGIRMTWTNRSAEFSLSALDVSILGNTIQNTERGIVLDGVSGVLLEGNRIESSSKEIIVGNAVGASNIQFTSNHFSRLGTSTERGVLLMGSLDHVNFENNEFVDIGSDQTKEGVAVLLTSGSGTNISFLGNTFSTPNGITKTAVQVDLGFVTKLGTWVGNVLMNGIQAGSFASH